MFSREEEAATHEHICGACSSVPSGMLSPTGTGYSVGLGCVNPGLCFLKAFGSEFT